MHPSLPRCVSIYFFCAKLTFFVFLLMVCPPNLSASSPSLPHHNSFSCSSTPVHPCQTTLKHSLPSPTVPDHPGPSTPPRQNTLHIDKFPLTFIPKLCTSSTLLVPPYLFSPSLHTIIPLRTHLHPSAPIYVHYCMHAVGICRTVNIHNIMYII